MRLEVVHRAPTQKTGHTLLLIHGVCHGAWCWANYLDAFAELGHDVHALSLRGHGASDGREALDSFGLADYVEDVVQVIEGLPEPPVLIGHSMGGAIVQKLLPDHDHRIRGAVLLASAVPGGLGLPWSSGRSIPNISVAAVRMTQV